MILSQSSKITSLITGLDDYMLAVKNGNFINSNGRIYSGRFFGNQYYTKYNVGLDKVNTRIVGNMGSYCKVITDEETIVTHEKISNFERLLHPGSFIRIHKSYIVSRVHIKMIEGNRILIAGQHIPIGQTYKSAVKRLLKL